MNLLNTTEHLKMVIVIHFMLFLFYHNKKVKKKNCIEWNTHTRARMWKYKKTGEIWKSSVEFNNVNILAVVSYTLSL